MKTKLLILAGLLIILVALVAFSPVLSRYRGGINASEDSWIRNSADLIFYAGIDVGDTETHRLDGGGGVVVAAPTDIATATPALLVQNNGTGNSLEIRNQSGTPVVQWDNTGASTQSAAVDLNGNELTLDADADTSITADTDDQIDIEVSGADDFQFTTNTFTALSGSTIAADTIAETTGANGVVIDSATVKDGGFLAAGTGLIDTAGITDGLVIDSDGDTTISAPTDDQIDFEISGSDEITLTASTFNLNDHVIDQDLGTENVGGLPSICTVSITYTAAAGGSGTVCTVTDGEVWLIHKVFINVTTNFDATGDDATLTIGDGNDADGFIVAADANLQTTFTEATGYAAGWYGLENGSNGAYTVDDGAFVYAPSGADETIDYLIDETSGETLAAGAATIYVTYTRLQ